MQPTSWKYSVNDLVLLLGRVVDINVIVSVALLQVLLRFRRVKLGNVEWRMLHMWMRMDGTNVTSFATSYFHAGIIVAKRGITEDLAHHV